MKGSSAAARLAVTACGACFPAPGSVPPSRGRMLALAVEAAALGPHPGREAVLVGSSRGLAPEPPGRQDTARARTVAVSYTGNALAGRLARALHARGPSFCVSAACASGAAAAITGAALVRAGLCDAVTAAGVDHGEDTATRARFEAAGLADASGDPAWNAPLCRTSRGIRLAAGAGVVRLEHPSPAAARGAAPLAWLTGTAMATHPGSRGGLARDPVAASAVLLEAIHAAGLAPSDIGYVHAHGNGNPASDAAEIAVLEAVFAGLSAPVPVVSTKRRTGHALGGTSAAEIGFAVMAVRDGVVPGNGRLADPYPSRVLRFPDAPEASRPCHALVCAFGFWGAITAMVVSRAD